MRLMSKRGISELLIIAILAVVFGVMVLYSQGIIPKMTGLVSSDSISFVEVYTFGPSSGNDGTTWASAVFNNKLYFGTYDGNITEYDGSTWNTAARFGANNEIWGLAVFNNALYAGDEKGNVSKYDGSTWTKIENLGSTIWSIGVFDGKLYVSTNNGNVSEYDGTSWTNKWHLRDTYAESFAILNDKLYVGVGAEVWEYNKSNWNAVKDLTNDIQTLINFNNKLYVETSNGTIWEYDGANWAYAGAVNNGNYALTVWNNEFYAGNGSKIAIFNSASKSWSNFIDLGASTNRIEGFGVYNNKLYAGAYEKIFALTSTFICNSDPITVTFPVSGTAYSYGEAVTKLTFNNNTPYSNLTNCWFSSNGGTTNSTPQSCAQNFTGLTAAIGNNIWTVYANSTCAGVVKKTVAFKKMDKFAGSSSSNPITISSPQARVYTTDNVTAAFSFASDVATGRVTKCEYSFNGDKTQFTCGNPLPNLKLLEGPNDFKVYAYDDQLPEPAIAVANVTVTYTPLPGTSTYSWKYDSGILTRTRYGPVPGVNIGTNDVFSIENTYGNIIQKPTSNSNADYLVTSGGYAYASTSGNKIIKLSLKDGSILSVSSNISNLNDASTFFVNEERGVLYVTNSTAVFVLNLTDLSINSYQDVNGVINTQIKPMMKNRKLFYYIGTNKISVIDMKGIGLGLQYNSTISVPSTITDGMTQIENTEFFAVRMSTKNISIVSSINLSNIKEYSSSACDSSLLTSIVSKDNYLYFMCTSSSKGILVEYNLPTREEKVYGLVEGINRLKNNYKNAFTVSNDWIYYGTTTGVTAVKRSNPGSEAASFGTIMRNNNLDNIASMVMSLDKVYAVNEDGKVYALNANNISQVIWNSQLLDTSGKVYSMLFASSNTLLVYGGDNNLYVLPKQVAALVSLEVSKEWVTQAGNNQRTRYVNTSGIITPLFKRVSFDTAKNGIIVKDRNKDSVLISKGYAYILNGAGKILKFSLATGKVVANTSDLGSGLGFAIDPSTDAIYATGLQSIAKTIKGYYRNSVCKLGLPEQKVVECTKTFYFSSLFKKIATASMADAKTLDIFGFYGRYYDRGCWDAGTSCATIVRDQRVAVAPYVPIIVNNKVSILSEDFRNLYRTCRSNPYLYQSKRNSLLLYNLADFETTTTFAEVTPPTFESSSGYSFDALMGCENRLSLDVSSDTNPMSVGNKIIHVTKNKVIVIIDSLTNSIESLKQYTSPCTQVTSELMSQGQYVYWICDSAILNRYDLMNNNTEPVDITLVYKPVNSGNALALNPITNKVYYGSNNRLVEIDTNSGAVIQKAINLNAGENITAITIVRDLIYAGTDSGKVYAINPNAALTLNWSKDVTGGKGEISSLVIPGEGSLMAVGGYNDIYVFGQAAEGIETSVLPNCNYNNTCDARISENCSTCPADCGQCSAAGGTPTYGCIGGVRNNNCEEGETPQNCGDCYASPGTQHTGGGGSGGGRVEEYCRRGETSSAWISTGADSLNDCQHTISGVNRECCPWGQTCSNFGGGVYKCIYAGLDSCSDYKSQDACNNYDPFTAFQSVNLNKGEGFCGSIDTNNQVTECTCSWDSVTSKCQPGWAVVQVAADGTASTVKTCSYSCSDGNCIGGIKTVQCSALPQDDASIGCMGSSTEASCYVPSELPFFTAWSIALAGAIIVGFYLMRARRR